MHLQYSRLFFGYCQGQTFAKAGVRRTPRDSHYLIASGSPVTAESHDRDGWTWLDMDMGVGGAAPVFVPSTSGGLRG